MRFFRLISANLLRKKVRTTLTIGSFMVALFLYGLLVAIRAAFSQGRRRCGRGPPERHQQDLADHAAAVSRTRSASRRCPASPVSTFATWFGGVYQDEKNFFPQFADRARELAHGLL